MFEWAFLYFLKEREKQKKERKSGPFFSYLDISRAVRLEDPAEKVRKRKVKKPSSQKKKLEIEKKVFFSPKKFLLLRFISLFKCTPGEKKIFSRKNT